MRPASSPTPRASGFPMRSPRTASSWTRCSQAGSRRDGLGAYLELHIEQGPVLETDGARTAAVNGCTGVERHRFTITGQASHAGTTPMELRRDAGLAAADAALRIEGIGREHDGVATTGVLRLDPGIPTAVAGEAELVADLRHRDAGELAAMLAEARAAIDDCAVARECSTAEEEIWRIEPLAFDPQLVEYARDACRIASGTERELTSGALHDAAEVSRHVPTAMIFVPSLGGLSHTEREDTDEADLATGIEAFGAPGEPRPGRALAIGSPRSAPRDPARDGGPIPPVGVAEATLEPGLLGEHEVQVVDEEEPRPRRIAMAYRAERQRLPGEDRRTRR